MKVYRISRMLPNKKAAEELVKELDESSEARWHLEEIDLDTGEVKRIV